MEKNLNTHESSETKNGKNSVWYNIFHWALVIYFFVATIATTIALCYGGLIFFDFLFTTAKSWM